MKLFQAFGGYMVFLSRSNMVTAEASEHPAVCPRGWRKPVAAFIALFCAVWLTLYAVYASLPLMRAGAVVIGEAKFDTLVTGRMFGPEDRNRVMVFGNSRVLTSTLPSELDAALGPGFRSYNLGLPGDTHMLPILEAALNAGNVPTHVLLMMPWDDRPTPDSVLDILQDQAKMAEILLPFRTILRDAIVFMIRHKLRFEEGFQEAKVERDKMLEDRGWYYIKWQSHYVSDNLPADFVSSTDHPTLIDRRAIPEKSFTRSRLEQLATQYGFEILFIPVPLRIGEFAPAPAADAARLTTLSDHPRIRILGPDYITYSPILFSDPLHTSPRGAHAYTADLAKLLNISGVFHR